jgi:Baseplate J-like protein
MAAPPVDQRTPADIADQTRALLKTYAPDWRPAGDSDPLASALIAVFGRFAELMISRLNQAPDKNFLTFLDLLSAALMPPEPARVPLTFSLAAGTTVDALVPAGTQVAAAPAEGEKGPAIFETGNDLVVTATQLSFLFALDPEEDRYDDLSALIAARSDQGIPIFHAGRRIDHILYLGHSRLLAYSRIAGLRLTFQLASTLADTRQVKWEIWDGGQWTTLNPTSDGTYGLANGGDIRFPALLPAVPQSQAFGINSRWIRGKLATPITPSPDPLDGLVRASQLPAITSVVIAASLAGQNLLPETLATNATPLAPATAVPPFGDKPKVGDAFYIASAEAFSKDRAGGLAGSGAQVRLDITLENSHLKRSGGVWPSPDLQMAWESWNGTSWEIMGTSSAPAWLRVVEVDDLPEITTATTVLVQGTAQKGATVSWNDGAIPVGGDGRFARQFGLGAGWNVILIRGNYLGVQNTTWSVMFQGQAVPPNHIEAKGPSAPVDTSFVSIDVRVIGTDEATVKTLSVTNGLTGIGTAPPYTSGGINVVVGLGTGRNDILIRALSAAGAMVAACMRTVALRGAQPDATVTGFFDGTYGFTQSGSVAFRLPNQVARTTVAGQQNYWVRSRLTRGGYGSDAAYRLLDVTAPAQGFMLVPASYRPPVVSSILIGYTQTLSDAPEAAGSENLFSSAAGQPAVWTPFQAAAETTREFYLGFVPTAGQATFPNRTMSVFVRPAEFKFGEPAVPFAPERSILAGEPGDTLVHRFTVIKPADSTLFTLGTRWPATITQDGAVTVQIPGDAVPGTRDRGTLVLQSADGQEQTAEFVTWSGRAGGTSSPKLAFEYWDGASWVAVAMRDETKGFTRRGVLQFLGPADFASSTLFGRSAYWLRVRHESGDYQLEPRLVRILQNTIMAAQTVTVRNETLGAGNGSAGQQLQTARAPVLAAQALQVREPELPPVEEKARIEFEEGADAIAVTLDATGRPVEIWVRWHEVPDFYASAPRDRHYTLDHITGRIQFGDGQNGLIPPAGSANIRMAVYQTGGGSAGNKPAGSIVQLKTTVPYVDKVTNPEPAEGGAEAETYDSLRARAPRTVRHRGRAVTAEDYADLALLATPEVARALTVPDRDLEVDPDGTTLRPGSVSVIIVPRSTDDKPLPSLELIGTVLDYVAAHAIPTADIAVVGPDYVRVDVAAAVALRSLDGAAAVQASVAQALDRFLHPLTGGLDGSGWDFGRHPHKSDLYALIEHTAGVDHVVSLDVTETPDRPSILASGRFLVYSGQHRISLTFEED